MGSLTAHEKCETTVYVRLLREQAHATAVHVSNEQSLFCFESATGCCIHTNGKKENNKFAGQNKHGSLAALNVRK